MIACENSKPGTPQSQWDINGAGSSTIQGFATDISVNVGGTISFKIKTPATVVPTRHLPDGLLPGQRRAADHVDPSVGDAAADPAGVPQRSPSTGLIDCGNWAVSASWTVPRPPSPASTSPSSSAPTTGGASHIVFVVRDDASHSDLLFQTSDTTWQAYNDYGGNSLYDGTAPDRTRVQGQLQPPFTTRGDTRRRTSSSTPSTRWCGGWRRTATTSATSAGVDTDRRGAAAQEPQGVPVRRPRRVLVGGSARQRRGRPRRRRQPGVLQRQRDLLEDPLGEQHRRPAARRTARWSATRRRTTTRSSIRRIRRRGPAPGATRASARRPTAGGPRTR